VHVLDCQAKQSIQQDNGRRERMIKEPGGRG
jgi:hypothetical protein